MLSKSRMPIDFQNKTITSSCCTAKGQYCCSVIEQSADLNSSSEGRERTHTFQVGKWMHNRFKFTSTYLQAVSRAIQAHNNLILPLQSKRIGASVQILHRLNHLLGHSQFLPPILQGNDIKHFKTALKLGDEPRTQSPDVRSLW